MLYRPVREAVRQYFVATIVPLLLVALAIPLIAGWIGRNNFYGFRTPRTLSSDRVWYPANRVAGLLFLGAGLVWLAAGLVAGLVAIGGAVLGSGLYVVYLQARPD